MHPLLLCGSLAKLFRNEKHQPSHPSQTKNEACYKHAHILFQQLMPVAESVVQPVFELSHSTEVCWVSQCVCQAFQPVSSAVHQCCEASNTSICQDSIACQLGFPVQDVLGNFNPYYAPMIDQLLDNHHSPECELPARRRSL